MVAHSAIGRDKNQAHLANLQRVSLHPAQMERHQRLRWAREHAGFKSAAEAARSLGVPYGTYSGHENSNRGIKDDELRTYARRFKVNLPWLAYGEGEPSAKERFKPSVGYIGAGAEIFPFDDHALGEGMEDVELPPGAPAGAVPVTVRGNSMHPRYFDGEHLFYVRDGRSAAELLGLECAVKLEDGRLMVKIIRKGSKRGFFHLESWNAPDD